MLQILLAATVAVGLSTRLSPRHAFWAMAAVGGGVAIWQLFK
jgi:hypothetical protein